MEHARKEAKHYLYTHLYGSPQLREDYAIAEEVVRDLFQTWVSDPSLLPPSYSSRVVGLSGGESTPRVVADYIAGMTDGFILQQHEAWSKGRKK